MGCVAGYRRFGRISQADLERIGCMGNSGGGTITFYVSLYGAAHQDCHAILLFLYL